jgi:hypothetical protein
VSSPRQGSQDAHFPRTTLLPSQSFQRHRPVLPSLVLLPSLSRTSSSTPERARASPCCLALRRGEAAVALTSLPHPAVALPSTRWLTSQATPGRPPALQSTPRPCCQSFAPQRWPLPSLAKLPGLASPSRARIPYTRLCCLALRRGEAATSPLSFDCLPFARRPTRCCQPVDTQCSAGPSPPGRGAAALAGLGRPMTGRPKPNIPRLPRQSWTWLPRLAEPHQPSALLPFLALPSLARARAPFQRLPLHPREGSPAHSRPTHSSAALSR